MACPVLENPTNLKDINITVCPYSVEEPARTPGVMWAQRENYIFLTVCVSDCQSPEIGVFEDKLHFKGVGGPEMWRYELDIQLLHNIDIDNSKYAVRPRVVEFRLEKEEHKWWERLLLDKTRQHWLRIDFQKWRDEDDVGDEKEPFEEMSWNTMMEGFEKQSKMSGQENFLETAKKQNDEVMSELDKVGGMEGFKRLAELKRLEENNKKQEAELEAKKAELADKEKFYKENAPPQVKVQLRDVFNSLREGQQEEEGPPRITEIDIDD